MAYSMPEIDCMGETKFVAAFGEIFEQTPEIARSVWQHRPFHSFDMLFASFLAAVQALSSTEQLDLIRAHPDLGSKVTMAAASVSEQAGVGLDCLSSEEDARFQFLNATYTAKFGFPFILAVRNHTKASILDAFEVRIGNTFTAERERAIAEICEIARFRLAALVEDGNSNGC